MLYLVTEFTFGYLSDSLFDSAEHAHGIGFVCLCLSQVLRVGAWYGGGQPASLRPRVPQSICLHAALLSLKDRLASKAFPT